MKCWAWYFSISASQINHNGVGCRSYRIWKVLWDSDQLLWEEVSMLSRLNTWSLLGTIISYVLVGNWQAKMKPFRSRSWDVRGWEEGVAQEWSLKNSARRGRRERWGGWMGMWYDVMQISRGWCPFWVLDVPFVLLIFWVGIIDFLEGSEERV